MIDDGLHRVVVTMNAASGAISHIDESTLAEGQSVSEGALTGTQTLTPELEALIPDDATLVAIDGGLGYRTSDGTLVRFDAGNETPGEGATVVESDDPTDAATADSAIWLASIDGVQTVTRITNDTYAVTTSSLAALEALGVAFAPDAPFALTADPYEPYQWSLDNDGLSLSGISSISAPPQTTDADVDGIEARTAATGRGVTVAVIDSGVDFTHPDLAESAWVNPGEDCADVQRNGVDDDANGFVDDCEGWDFGEDDETRFVAGSSDHGTHVAGIIAADATNGFGVSGMAPNVRIMDLKVDDAQGAISGSAIARAIHYAVDNGADVVNLSLGSQPGAPIESVAAIAEAVEYAGANGVLLVVAAGNNGQSLDDAAVYPASFNAAHMLVVAASGPSDLVAAFSNTGSAVDLMAPGELILSTVAGDELAFMSGTSQAAPMVAAAAAQVLEGRPDAAPSVVIEMLLTSADDVVSDGSRPPRLNSARAVGVEADSEAGGAVAIRNLVTDDAGQVEAEIVFPAVEGQFNQPFHWELSLVSIVDGSPFAIIDHPVTTGGGSDIIVTSTNSRGAVMLAAEDAASAAISTNLPPGSYALLIEAIPRTDSTVRLGDAFVAGFTVGDTGDSGGVGAGTTENGVDADQQPDSTIADSAEPGTDSGADSTQPASDDTGSDGGSTTGSNGSQPADDPATPTDTGSSTTTTISSNTTSDATTASEPPEDSDDGATDDVVADDRTTTTIAAGVDGGASGSGASSTTQRQPDADAGDDATNEDSATASSGPIEVGSDTAIDGNWSISDITPQTGLIDEETLVRISGSFPSEATVWFGGQPAETIISSEQLMVVRTRRHAEPETVDVTFRTRADGIVLSVPDGFAFLRPDDDRPVIQSGADDPGDASNAGSDPGFGLDPDQVVVDPPAPTEDRDSGKSRNRQARAEITGSATLLPNGLSGVPLSGLDTIGDVPACNEPLCRTRRV